MTKYIVFKMQDGSEIGLPLKAVAEARAKYYAERDKDTTFESEVEFVMNDHYEGTDWFYNNQNPEDFTGQYVVLKGPTQLTLEQMISSEVADHDVREVEDPKPPTVEQLQAAQTQIADAYLEAQLRLLKELNHGELNYIKTAVEMPNGGKYRLQFSHVDGPKTDVQELFRQRAGRIK